jgi:enoyl-[acyl-carrier protein] reductase I
MEGKRGLIMGLANERSLAWGIARALSDQGAELAFSYQGEALEKRVRPLASELGSGLLVDCDVSDMKALDKTFDALKEQWERLDFVVHAIGFSDKNELRGKFVETSMDNFLMTMNISVYSFVAVAQRARALMAGGGSLLTLTYYGAEKVIPHYNVMGVAKSALETSVKYLAADLGPEGIRVNAISAGPIKTASSRQVAGLSKMLDVVGATAPLRRNVTADDVGKTAVYLASDLSSSITADVHFVDAGFHAMGMFPPSA